MMDQDFQIKGFRFSATAAGIKKEGATRLDMALIVPETPANVAGMTTTNLVYAAPIQIMRENLATGKCSGILINSGNANACLGNDGLLRHRELIDALANEADMDREKIIPMSTGVIGNPLPVERMIQRLPELVKGLGHDKAMDVARAMMTTDTRPKIVSRKANIHDEQVSVLGMAKGSGMIAPNMATMLALLLVDAKLDNSTLAQFLQEAVSTSFNRITIDGDMSTNDAIAILSASRSDAVTIEPKSKEAGELKTALIDVCQELAHMMVEDGEGATKVARIVVNNCHAQADAIRIARMIAESPLVKTAFNGSDPNWGRIMAAAGRAGVAFDPDKADLYIGEVLVYTNGGPASDDWEEKASRVMREHEFTITLDLGSGGEHASLLTSDFSKEYVMINADYRT